MSYRKSAVEYLFGDRNIQAPVICDPKVTPMSGVIESLFGLTVPHGKLAECISALEDGLRSIKETPYHAVLGRDFLHHIDDAAEFIAQFYQGVTRNGPIGAMYFEMNGFTINPDRWYFNGFAYEKGGTIWDLTWDTEWLNPWDAETDEFTLTGMELVQDAFRDYYCDDKQPLGIRLAGEITEHLVVARFNQLIGAAHRAAKESCHGLFGLPVLSTAHDWDRLSPST